MKMASRLDAVASRIETAVRMNQITGSMQGVVKGMSVGLQSMDIEKVSRIMDKFEQQFEDLDVKTQFMEGAMNATTATSTPVEDVDDLVKFTAEQNNLVLGEQLQQVTGSLKKKESKETNKPEAVGVSDDLESRLANLRS
mmetsp:Transcript_7192/g.11028  ORF Transcript_7192/g.11028 Transcript_7192/m.11028 type:complete len:140 (-) Transcript_7192:951-1370(-)